jgi:hypothetical protein
MIHSEFERATKDLKQGDRVALTFRGNYQRYTVEGLLVALKDDRVYLDCGFSHHYKRIVSMCKVEEERE